MKKIILIVCSCVFLIGCENNIGGDIFFNQIQTIEDALEHPDWTEVAAKAKELKQIYKEEKWKIQLLGDEDEYESLYESINKLIVASDKQDQMNTHMELSVIHTHIEDIYSL